MKTMKIPDLAHGQQDGETGDLPSFANRKLSPHQAPAWHPWAPMVSKKMDKPSILS